MEIIENIKGIFKKIHSKKRIEYDSTKAIQSQRVDELLKYLDRTFETFNAKLASKINLAHENYRIDYDTITAKLKSQHQYEEGLNKQRDELLNQLVLNRNEKLKEIDELKSKLLSHDSLIELKNKLNYLTFSPSRASVYDTILCRSKIKNELGLAKLAKYSKFISSERKISLVRIKEKFPIERVHEIFKLTSNSIFLFCYTNNAHLSYMITMSKSGQVLISKKISDKKVSCWSYNVKVAKANIIVICGQLVSVYDFKLEFINSIRVGLEYCSFSISDNEIGFYDNKNFVLACYNIVNNGVRTYEIGKETFLVSSVGQKKYSSQFRIKTFLADFNDKFILVKKVVDGLSNSLLVFDRLNQFCLYEYGKGLHLNSWVLIDAQIFGMGYYEMTVYGFSAIENTEDDFEMVPVGDKGFFGMFLNSRNKYVYDKETVRASDFVVLSEY